MHMERNFFWPFSLDSDVCKRNREKKNAKKTSKPGFFPSEVLSISLSNGSGDWERLKPMMTYDTVVAICFLSYFSLVPCDC